MENTTILPSLSMMTLIIVVLIAAIGTALFFMKRRNRHPIDKAPDDTIAAVHPPRED